MCADLDCKNNPEPKFIAAFLVPFFSEDFVMEYKYRGLNILNYNVGDFILHFSFP